MKKYYADTFEMRINYICQKLQYSITPFQVLEWLDNFEESEYELALSLLEVVKYFSESEMFEAYKKLFCDLYESFGENKKIYIMPIGEAGKSGVYMLYYVRKALESFGSRNKLYKFILKEEDLIELIKSNEIGEDSIIVLVDDFFGSGNSIAKHYSNIMKQHFINKEIKPCIYLLCIAAMEEGRKNLENKIPGIRIHIFYPEMKKVFSSESSPLGYRPKMLKVRDMCYRYGKHKELCIHVDKKSKKKNIFPLGYSNSQAAVVFPYGTPNNTIPVIWSTRSEWKPIFPRTINIRINKAKDLRKEVAYMLSKARIFGYEQYASGHSKTSTGRKFIFTTKMDFQLFLLVQLLRANRPKIVILQILGINISDYEVITKEAIKRGLLNNDERTLTEEGLRSYFEVLKHVNNYKIQKNESEVKNNKENMLYIPKTFRGKT